MHTSNSFIRVIDQLLPVLAVIRQSSDLDLSLPPGSEASDEDESEQDSLEHRFHLRPELQVIIELPVDFSPQEAERLAAFIRALPQSEGPAVSATLAVDAPTCVEVRRGAHTISMERVECKLIPWGTIYVIRVDGRTVGSADDAVAARFLFSQFMGVRQ